MPRANGSASIAGTGTNDTAATIRATRRAAELGADAALVVAPYYNRPDQRMLEAHFRAVADDGDLPIVVYNVPSRTGANVEADTFLRLADHPRIVAVKEACGQPRPDRADLPRPPGRRRRPRRRRRLDARRAGDGRRRRHLGGIQRSPGRMVGAVRRGPGRRLGCRPPDCMNAGCRSSRATSMAPEPGAGQGRPRDDGPLDRTWSAAAAAARRRHRRPPWP